MFACLSEGCNRKYTREAKLRLHIEKVHSVTDQAVITAHLEREQARIERGEPIPGPNKPPKETRAERQARVATEEAEKRAKIAAEAHLTRLKYEADLAAQQEQREAAAAAMRADRAAAETAALERQQRLITEIRESLGGRTKPDDLPDELLCKICMIEESNAVILNCGHEIACYDCLEQMRMRGPIVCPGCRGPVLRYIKKIRL